MSGEPGRGAQQRIVELVRTALDNFEDVPLAASLRRSLRIAQLRGDSRMAVLARLDLRPLGGSAALRVEEITGLMPELTREEAGNEHDHIIEIWLHERRTSPDQDGISSPDTALPGDVDELERMADQLEEEAGAVTNLGERIKIRERAGADRALLGKIR